MAIAALALVFISGPGVPAAGKTLLTTKELATNCSVATGSGLLFCLGFIRGVVESEARRSEAERAFCPPALGADARRRIFRKWHERNRAKGREMTAADAVVEAFRERYPCPDRSREPGNEE